jgi:hypothetical protein
VLDAHCPIFVPQIYGKKGEWAERGEWVEDMGVLLSFVPNFILPNRASKGQQSPMSLIQKKKNLKDQVARAEQGEAFHFLLDQVRETSTEQMNALCLLRGRFVKNEKSRNGNLVGKADYDLETANINHALLDLIDGLRDADLKDDFAEVTAALRQQVPPPLPYAALVNGDRQQAFSDFETAYEAQGERPTQFYFFAGCPTQKPASFAERVVYEIVHEVLADNRNAIFYETIEEEVGPRRVERLLVRPLPFAKLGPAEACQTRFEACVAEALDVYRQHLLDRGGDLSVAHLVDMPAGQVPVQLFTLAFRIDFAEMTWGDKLRNHLRWIVSTFHQRRFIPPAFQFVFVVQANGHHLQPDPSVLALRDFVKNLNAELNGGQPDAPHPCAWSEAFQPLSPDDLYNWLRLRFKGNPDLGALRRAVDQYTEQLRRMNRLGPQNAIDMSDAEEFTKMVYVASHSLIQL